MPLILRVLFLFLPRKPLLIDRVDGFLVTRDGSRTYTGTNTDWRFKKTFRVSETTFTFILGGIQYDLQRDAVIIIIDKNHTFQRSLISNKN